MACLEKGPFQASHYADSIMGRSMQHIQGFLVYINMLYVISKLPLYLRMWNATAASACCQQLSHPTG